MKNDLDCKLSNLFQDTSRDDDDGSFVTDDIEIEDGITLAEALQLRADAQKRIAQIGARLSDNAKVQEGETPAEDPLELIALLNKNTDLYQKLICRINKTNAATGCDGATLTDMLARRDALSLKTSILRRFLSDASNRVERYSKTEIKVFSTVDVPKLQKVVDAYSKELRQLDTQIQRLNWNTTLL